MPRTRRATSAPALRHSGRTALRATVALVVLAALAVVPLAAARTEASPRVELVVGFDGAAPTAALAAAGARVEERLPAVDAARVSVPAAGLDAALAGLRAAGAVDYAAREGVRGPALAPNDPLYASSRWPFVETALARAWDLTTGDPDIVVAVLDSGVDASHPDLPPLAAGYDFVNEDADPADDFGHGTVVAGALGARLGNGLGSAGACPGCTLMPVKVIDGVTGVASDGDIVEGIVWATDHGADVINLSLGGPGFAQVLQDAVAYATSRGVVVVAAAGNDGTTVPHYPAALEGVLGVAASDRNDRLEAFSNHGAHVALAAPGCVHTAERGGGYGQHCGTSVAAPLVAGIAGLVRAGRPELSGAQVAAMLTGGANGALGLDVAHGLVDAYRALALAGVTAPPAAVTIAGTAKVGRRLTASPGGAEPARVRYQWQSCGTAAAALRCADLQGRTEPTLLLGTSLVGRRLRVRTTEIAPDGTHAVRASRVTAPVRR